MPPKNIIHGQLVHPEKLQCARQLRRAMTPAESLLWQRLRGGSLKGWHFRRQQVIDGYIVDFYCHAAALVIEIDGQIHAQQIEADRARERTLQARGLRVIRFTNQEVLDQTTRILEEIEKACEPCPPPL